MKRVIFTLQIVGGLLMLLTSPPSAGAAQSVTNFDLVHAPPGGIPSFSITGETSEPFIPPLLNFSHSGTNLFFSWPDPNEIFELEGTLTLDRGEEGLLVFFETMTNAVAFLNDFRSLRLPIERSHRHFFRLRHGQPRLRPPVD